MAMSNKSDEEKSKKDELPSRETKIRKDIAPKDKTSERPTVKAWPSSKNKSAPSLQQPKTAVIGGSEEYIKNKSSFRMDDDSKGAKTADDTPSLDKHGGWLHPLEDKADVVERKPKRIIKNRTVREFNDLNDYIDDEAEEENSLEQDERLTPICRFRGHAFCKVHRKPRLHSIYKKGTVCRFNNRRICCTCCPFRLRAPLLVEDVNFYDRTRVPDDICPFLANGPGCGYPCYGYSMPFELYCPRNCSRPGKEKRRNIRKNYSSPDDIDPMATCLVNKTSTLFKEAVKEWENQEDDETNAVGLNRSLGTDEKVERRHSTNKCLKKNNRHRY